ncbi:MAG: TetR/AcrR family transcriptional regulator [Deltaproteobacteria bacterium]|nr:TetR/AcrR family transcriptional regulator [Deltaproteobacteria bacterium]
MAETVRSTFLNLPPAKQEKVLEAALAEFADKGYEQASVNVMVSASGIAKGSLYQYFKDKKHTLVRVKEDTAGEDFFTRLERSLMAGVEFIRQHPRIYRLYLKILFDQRVPQREVLLKAVRRFAADYLGSLVRQGMARGEIRADLPGDTLVFLLDALLDRFLQALCVPAFDVTLNLDQVGEEEVRRRVQELVAILRAGLAADSGETIAG